MSSKRILRSVLVAVVAVGLVAGPAGAAVAAPERSEGVRAGWTMDVGEWVDVVWGWLRGLERPADTEGSPIDRSGPRGLLVESTGGANEGSGGWDPNG